MRDRVRDIPTWVAAALVCLAAMLVPATPGAGAAPPDDAVATVLFENGKAAFGKRDYDEAITFFRKALQESDDLIEAEYYCAQAYEKLKQMHEALCAYREYLSLFAGKESLGEVSKSESSFAAKAQKAVEKLGAGERELDALNAAFVAKLVAVATARADDQPVVAREACEHVLALDPDNPTAAELLARLGGNDVAASPVGIPPPGPFERLAKGPWQDFIAQKTLGTKLLRYGDSSMTIDVTVGKMSTPVERVRIGERYVIELDFRVLEVHAPKWLVGVSAGFGGGDTFYSAFAQQGQVVLNAADAKTGPREDVDTHPMAPIDPRRWHRLGVRVEGRAMVVWFDGDVVARTEVPDAACLQGDVGLFVQACKAEIRLLHVATLE